MGVIAIGYRPQTGPWGGGNRAIALLAESLTAHGFTVCFDLDRPDIDLILMTDPRTRSPNVTFGAGAILRYLLTRNPRAVVIHRINECDERKGEAFINAKLVRANYAADFTVFVGRWLVDLPVWRRSLHTPWRVVRNGADTRLFNPVGLVPWDREQAFKLVTHHWGYHPMKGFDIYAQLDAMLAAPKWKGRLAFTYVGNVPRGFSFKNARHITPLDGADLAAELRQHHAYVTASQNEPGGNHQNEGALCGLPLLYRRSGCLPEYCDGFGVPFDAENFEDAVGRLREDYEMYAARMSAYPHTADHMTQEWLSLFRELLLQRDELVSRRRLFRSPTSLLAAQWPF